MYIRNEGAKTQVTRLKNEAKTGNKSFYLETMLGEYEVDEIIEAVKESHGIDLEIKKTKKGGKENE